LAVRVAAAGVAAAALAACGGSGAGGDASTAAAGPSPAASVSVGAAASATPEPSPTLRPVPPEAGELSEAGAVAFLQWWVEMYNYVEATGETDLVFEHSEPGCTFCQNFVERVDPVYAAGGRIEREAPTRFLNADPSLPDSNAYSVVTLDVSSGASLTYGKGSELLRSAPGDDPPFRAVVGLQWGQGAWRFVDLGTEES
jgi:hypothetical protein